MTINDIDEKLHPVDGVERPKVEPGVPKGDTFAAEGSINMIALFQFLDVDSMADRLRFEDKANTLLSYVRHAEGKVDPETISRALSRLESRIVSPKWGETKIASLSRMAYLLMEKASAEQQLKNMYE